MSEIALKGVITRDTPHLIQENGAQYLTCNELAIARTSYNTLVLKFKQDGKTLCISESQPMYPGEELLIQGLELKVNLTIT